MPSDRARRFTSRREAEAARPRLSLTNPVPLDRFADLVGDYKFRERVEWIHCQLIDEKGRCKQLHGWGWIVQLADGSEGYVGHECAEDHFSADPRFAPMFAEAAARVDREIETDALVARLARLLADTGLPGTLSAAMLRRQRISDRVMHVRNLLPPRLLKKLVARGRDATVTIRVLYIEVEIEEKTGRRREVVKPQEFRWGALNGLEGLDDRPLSKIGGKLSEASAALAHAVASLDQPVPSMKKWAHELEYVERAGAELDRHESLIDNFCRLDSLKLLWLLLPDRFDQLAAINAALEIATRKRVKDEQAAAARERWSQEIRDAHRGRAFEIVG